jgi:hypothetical protein
MDKKQQYLDLSLKHLQMADHIAYVTFPLVKEKKLLLKIFEEIHKSLINMIFAMLVFEKKKIQLNKDNKKNIKNFIKSSKNYKINNEEIKKIIEIIELSNKHHNSAMEFSRKEKVVIMMDNLNISSIDIQKIKEYLSLSKSLYLRINLKLNN